MHTDETLKNGISVLSQTPGCLALFPFDEREGNYARDIIRKNCYFFIPSALNSFALSPFNLSYKEMRFHGYSRSDFLKNIAFFIPFGLLLSAMILRRHNIGAISTFLIVILAGGFLSYVIEHLQLLIPTRSTDMADILGNSMGSGIGAIISLMLLYGINKAVSIQASKKAAGNQKQ